MFKARQEYNDKILAHLKKMGLCKPDNKKFQIRTLNHKQAFIAIMMELGLEVSDAAILHDTDKLVLYGLLERKYVSTIHRKYSTHHFYNSVTDEDLTQCVIDYESGRFTKKHNATSAYDYIINRTSDYYEKLKPTLVKLGLDKGTNIDNKFGAWNHCDKGIIKVFIDRNIEAITILNKAISIYGEQEAIRMFYAGELKI